MKAFNENNTVTYNLLSFTAFKSLLVFALLLESPKTYDEIREYFKNHPFLHEEVSVDTIRVYMTSLKRVGCEIVRLPKSQGGKYQLLSHPYQFQINDKQINGLIKIYKIIAKTLDITDLYAFDKFLKNLADKIDSKPLLSKINEVSYFKKSDTELLEHLIQCSKNKQTITVLYDSPKSGKKEIKVITDKLAIYRGNIYLYGINMEYNQESSFLINRIIKIVKIHKEEIKTDIKTIVVGYELSAVTPNIKLSENETIVEINDESVIIEAKTTNLFMMKRRILEYGPICTVLYPEDFRADIIKTLKDMQKEYSDD